MSWNYSGDPSSSTKDEVRFLIGDTNINDQAMSDEEINFLIVNHPNVDEAGYEACTRLCAKFAPLMDMISGKTQISWSQKYEHYRTMADILNAKFSDTPQVWNASMDSPDKDSLDRNFDCHTSFI